MATINSYNICFLGRTGNGKSSLINEIWGTHFPKMRMYIFYIITNQICKVLKLMFNSDVLKLYKFFKKSNNKYSEQ